MSITDKILKRLNRVFKKDPIPVAGVTLSGTGYATVSDSALTISTNGATKTIQLTEHNLSTLVATINGDASLIPTVAATLNATGTIPARAILDCQTNLSGYGQLNIPSSVTYQEMQVYGHELHEQHRQLKSAQKQLNMNTAEVDWQDVWNKDGFGITRNQNESDAAYRARTINELLRPTQNNIALENIIQSAFGIKARIIDKATATEPPDYNQATRFLLDMYIPNTMSSQEAVILIAKIKATIRKYKADGTDFSDEPIRKLEQVLENIVYNEDMHATITGTFADGLVAGKLVCGTAWVCGSPGLICGINNPTVEQAWIKVVDASTDEVISYATYGG